MNNLNLQYEYLLQNRIPLNINIMKNDVFDYKNINNKDIKIIIETKNEQLYEEVSNIFNYSNREKIKVWMTHPIKRKIKSGVKPEYVEELQKLENQNLQIKEYNEKLLTNSNTLHFENPNISFEVVYVPLVDTSHCYSWETREDYSNCKVEILCNSETYIYHFLRINNFLSPLDFVKN